MPLPPPDFHEFIERVRVLGELYGLSITSWGRTDQHNKNVRGHENSWHRWGRGGCACDLQTDLTGDAAKEQLEQAAGTARKLGMDAVVYAVHVHVEPADPL